MSYVRPIFVVICASLFTIAVLFINTDTPEVKKTNYKTDKTYRFTLLQTNDMEEKYVSSIKQQIDDIRAEISQQGGYSLLISGGDVIKEKTGENNRAAIIESLNNLNYDAMIVGSLEFYNGLQSIREAEGRINFPMLSANIYTAETGYPLFDAFRVIELDGLSIGVIGLTETQNSRITDLDNIKDIDFRTPVETAQWLVPELKQQTDVVIAATHMNHDRTSFQGDTFLAQEVEGLDLVIGGHCSKADTKPLTINNTLVLQARTWKNTIARVDFEFRNGQLNMTSYELIPMASQVE